MSVAGNWVKPMLTVNRIPTGFWVTEFFFCLPSLCFSNERHLQRRGPIAKRLNLTHRHTPTFEAGSGKEKSTKITKRTRSIETWSVVDNEPTKKPSSTTRPRHEKKKQEKKSHQKRKTSEEKQKNVGSTGEIRMQMRPAWLGRRWIIAAPRPLIDT